MKVYRITDRIPVAYNGLTFWLAPITYEKQGELLNFFRVKQGEDQANVSEYGRAVLRACLKGVDGLEEMDGSKFELCFDANGEVTDESLDDLLTSVGHLTNVALRTATDRLAFDHSQFDKLPEMFPGLVIDFSKTQSLKKK